MFEFVAVSVDLAVEYRDMEAYITGMFVFFIRLNSSEYVFV